jgi:hypothetical protein
VRGEFGDPKSFGSGRSVPMAERIALALRELRERSVYSHDRDLVFCHPETGKPLDRSKLVRRFKQAIDRAGVHRITTQIYAQYQPSDQEADAVDRACA